MNITNVTTSCVKIYVVYSMRFEFEYSFVFEFEFALGYGNKRPIKPHMVLYQIQKVFIFVQKTYEMELYKI